MMITPILRSLWNREYSLKKTFWLFGILSFPIAAVIYAVTNVVLIELIGLSRLAVYFFTTPIMIIFNAYLVFFAISLIRVSMIYDKNALWKYCAMLFALFLLVMGCINVFRFTGFFFFISDSYNKSAGRVYRSSLPSKILGWALILGIVQIIRMLFHLYVNYKSKKNATSYLSTSDEDYDEYEEEEEEDEPDI